MAMIKGHDYVIVTSWRCPYCHKFHGMSQTKIGRYPFSTKLLCQGCAQEWYPAQADEVSYD